MTRRMNPQEAHLSKRYERGKMFDEDGSLNPTLKFILLLIVAAVIAKAVWRWLTQVVWNWVSVKPWGWISEDMWGWLTCHPLWFALISLGILLLLGSVFFSGRTVYANHCDPLAVEEEYAHVPTAEAPTSLTYQMEQLTAMTANGFEQACADLLARDGFTRARRVGGPGDLGADVVAWDPDGRKIVVQCKQYSVPVRSEAVHQFNGTARPVHDADVPIMVGLNGFTKPASDFACQHNITLVAREELRRWAHGEHLYMAVTE